MKKKRYVVLREKQIGRFMARPKGVGPRIFESMVETTESPEPKVELESFEKKDLTLLDRDRDVVGYAMLMPVKLVVPFEVTSSELNEEDRGTTWGVEVSGASGSAFNGNGVKVAVLDTGIDEEHEAFSGCDLLQKDFTGEGNGDKNSHGSHCAGTIFGKSKDGFRYSIAPGIKQALIGKVLDKNGGGDTNHIYNAILWAVENSANVISMSLGLDFPGFVEQLIEDGYPADLATSVALEGYRANLNLFNNLSAMVSARSSFGHQAILVAAAGNESKRHIDPDYEIAVAPPAVAEGIISVGALKLEARSPLSLSVANFSNTAPILSAPGVDVFSAKAGGGYVRYSGTSMATPHVAGIACLWADKELKETGTINPMILTSRIIGLATKENMSSDTESSDIGAGLVQAP